LLQAYPTMPATVIAERIGWTRSIRVLRDRVAELRPAYMPPDPASRTSYEPGEIAQRSASDMFAGWWLIERLGSVPRVLVWDGDGAIGRWRTGRVELTAECQASPGTLGAKVTVCKLLLRTRPGRPGRRAWWRT
jgi:hypothetical protein